MPCLQRLIQGASGIGASICFKLNSLFTASSSTFGIIFGGFMNGVENDRRALNVMLAPSPLVAIGIIIGSN